LERRGNQPAQSITGGTVRKTQLWIALGCCVFTVVAAAGAQSKPKAGLWEVTSSMSMGGSQAPQMPQNIQLPPGVKLPPGVQMPQGGGSPFGAHTSQICVTQAQIDKYGGPSPTSQSRGDCKVTDVSMKDNGMTASIACTGQMTGNGTVETTWSDGGNTTSSTIHMKGTVQRGQNSMPVDMTIQSKSIFKGADCGDVKPLAMPADAGQSH
jgi:hypothetical protein